METRAAEGTQQAVAGSSEYPPADAAGAGELVDEEILVEDVSIDGMCGVY